MKARDLTFSEIEGDPPPFGRCNYCGKPGVRLGAVIPLSDQGGDSVIVVMCSPACVSVFRRDPNADALIAAILARVENARQSEQWPDEIDL